MICFVPAAAAVLDFLLGEPPVPLHPTVWMGAFIGWFWKKRPKKHLFEKRAFQFFWGILLVLSGVFLFGGALYSLVSLTGQRGILYFVTAVPLLKVSFSLKYLLAKAKEAADALKQEDLAKARKLVSLHLVSRDTSKLNKAEIGSCIIESLAENITDSFSSPLFYFFLAGLPGAWIFRFINTGDAMIAYRTGEYEWAGKFTAWCDSFLNLIPARVTALVIVAASALMSGSSGRGAWKCMMQDHGKTASPNAGWTMAAMAGGLAGRLEKKGEYVLGGDFPLPEEKQIDSCLKITLLSIILILAGMTGVYGGLQWVLNMGG